MTLPARGSVAPDAPTNSISMKQLRSEYTNLGDLTEVRFSSFYYGASNTSSYLPKNSCTDSVRATASDSVKHPALGLHFQGIPEISDPKVPIRLSDFYGKAYYYAPQEDSDISGNDRTFNVSTIEDNAIKTNVVNSAFIDLNVTDEMRATTTSKVALNISSKKRDNTTVWINVQSGARVVGKGGNGGNANNGAGSPGGDALHASSFIFINNNGRILGGGGGGSASGCNNRSYNECYCCETTNAGVGGNGGGGGKGGGAGGAAGDACGGNFRSAGFSGSNGNYDNTGGGGAGGSGVRCPSVCVTTNTATAGGEWGNAAGGGRAAGGAALKTKAGMYYKFTRIGTIAGTTSDTFLA